MSEKKRRPLGVHSQEASAAVSTQGEGYQRNCEKKGLLEWTYEDEDGNPLRKVRQVIGRDGSPRFCQFCQVGGGWKRGADGVRVVPYRLPQLNEAISKEERIFIVQGEKCVHALIDQGFVATTNPEGASDWPHSFQEFFRDARVVLVPTNDRDGHHFMKRVGRNLSSVVSNLRVVQLQGLNDGENVCDWIARGGDRRELMRLVNQTKPSVESPKRADARSRQKATGWASPIPLDVSASLPAFPVTALPRFLAEFVTAVANTMQVPVDLPGVLSLVVTATVVSNMRIRIRSGFVMPLNLYAVIALAVGEGKSPVYRELIGLLDQIEAELREEALPKIRQAAARREVAEADLTVIRKQLKDRKLSPDERASLTPMLEEAQAAVDAIHVPAVPDLYGQDATPEGLLKLLVEQGGRMSVLDDEGGELFELLRRYSKSGRANQGVYLRGHDGGRMQAEWSTKDSVDVDEILLTLGLTVQPQVISQLYSDPALRGRGLLARFLFSLPGSNVGYRNPWTTPIPASKRSLFLRRLETLAERTYGSETEVDQVIRLSAQASALMEKWSRRHEARLRPDGDLAAIADWGNKLPGQIARLSGLLHILSHPENPYEKPVSSRTVERSVELADYFAEHAKAAFKLMGADPVIMKATRIAEWLRGKTDVSKRDIQRARQDLFRSPAEVAAVIDLLTEYGYLRRISVHGFKSGGRPSERFSVNPLIP